MRTDDPIILRRIQEIEAACAGLRMACGFPDPHAPTSRREGQTTITMEQGTELIRREWDNYPDRLVLADELTDRGLTPDQAAALIAAEDCARVVNAGDHSTESE